MTARQQALGILGQCVMSIYGIARSLENRELGPAQLLPAIEDFRASSSRGCAAAHAFITTIETRTKSPALIEPVHVLAAEVRRVMEDVSTLFAGATKLGARERLELERNIVRVGGGLQASHRLLVLMEAALSPRPIQLSLSDLVRGQWGPRAAFVTRRIELCVMMSAGVRFVADPQVAWAILERFLLELPEEMTTAFAQVEEMESGPSILRVGDAADFTRSSLMRCTFDLGPRLAVEAQLLDAITTHLGWSSSKRDDEVQIAFAAA